MDTIYVESQVRDHPSVDRILRKFGKATVVECERYGEVFNPRSQNFRLQKKQPALILARKHGRKVLPAPPGYSIGRSENHYFSHMLNCLYDCRYCFLQGMYRSAHHVHFVNYEDFEQGIDETREKGESGLSFFSGYDCDSLAMEPVTGFAGHFLPFFADRPDSWFELRTKSLQTQVLESGDPLPNVVVAYTLTPDAIAREIEHGAPPYERRLNRVRSLAEQGWQIGFRLDPLVPWPGFRELYDEMIDDIEQTVAADRIHSVTLGPMRFPKAMHDRIVRLYPDDPLFALEETVLRNGQMTYPADLEQEMVEFVSSRLGTFLPRERIFQQEVGEGE